jgi:asparagine synthase (glutamine-hydrolysing)
MFRNVKRLLPGHFFELRTSSAGLTFQTTQYWDVPPPAEERHSEADWIAETRRRLEETVKMRLMADVPLGAFLSGGADSSAITALMQRSMGRNVKTFSVGYREQEYSELSFAAEVARHLGTDHHEVLVGFDDFFGALPRLIWHEDEPITWPSSVSLHFVSQLAAQHVKVVLTGEGADEMFGGYERYSWTRMNLQAGRLWNLAPEFARAGVRDGIAKSALLSGTWRRKLGHTFLGRETSVESLLVDNFYSAFPREERRALLGSREGTACDAFMKHWNAREGASLVSQMLYADQKTYLAELLMKQDQMSMSTSIESRVPFLDHTFVEFSTRVPDSMRIRGKTQKYIMKEAVKEMIPNEILFRRKMGFPTPLRDWLRRPEAAALVDPMLAPDSFIGGYLDLAPVRNMIAAHRAGRLDATDRIWRLINLETWGGIFFTRSIDPQASAVALRSA